MAWSQGRDGKDRKMQRAERSDGLSSQFCCWICRDRGDISMLLSICTALKGKMGSSHPDPGWNVPGVCGAGNAESFQVKGRTRAEDLAGREGIWQPAKCRIYTAGSDVIHPQQRCRM